MSMHHPSDFGARAAALVKQMTLEEKTSLCSGASFWNLKTVERLGLRKATVSARPASPTRWR